MVYPDFCIQKVMALSTGRKKGTGRVVNVRSIHIVKTLRIPRSPRVMREGRPVDQRKNPRNTSFNGMERRTSS